MTTDLFLTDVRPWGGPAVDLLIADGAIAAVSEPGGGAPEGVPTVDGAGRLVVPSFTDTHVHLDSTRLGLPWRPNDAPGGIWPNVMHDRANWRRAEVSMTERSTIMVGELVRHGTTRIRGYAQIDADAKLERFEAVLAAKEAFAGHADITIMAFPQAGLLREPGVPELIDEALRSGAQVMGGIDPCALDQDPVRHLDIVFSLAERHAVPIDIHLHEPGELGLFTLGLILDRTEALGLRSLVTISHAFALAHAAPAVLSPLLDRMAALDVAVTTCAPAGRNTLPLREITAAGLRIGLGDDGQRDYWSPYGNGDLLDRAWQLAFTNGFRNDELVEHALVVATAGGRSVIDPAVPRVTGVADRPGVAVGDAADLVLLAGDAVAAAVMDRLPQRTVIHRGRVVADNLELI